METLDDPRAVDAHYGHVDLEEAVRSALHGVSQGVLTPDDLAPLDQFHTGGQEATRTLAALADLRPDQSVLDVGGGLGGAARTLAAEFGCAVTVLDVTAAYCRLGRLLTARTALTDRVSFVRGDALRLPFRDEGFDAAWLQHSTMNIADKEQLVAEVYRVLRPAGVLALHEIATGQVIPARFPVPWAATQERSFLLPASAMRVLLASGGFDEVTWADVTEATLAAIMTPHPARAATSPLCLTPLLGATADEQQRNLVCNLAERRVAIVRGVFIRH